MLSDFLVLKYKGVLHLCDKSFVANDMIFTTTGNYDEVYRTGKYIRVHERGRDPLLYCEDVSKVGLPAYGSTQSRTFKSVQTLDPSLDIASGTWLSKEEVDKILNPHPQAVLEIAEILKGCGNVWVDDTREVHVDDIEVLSASTRIYEALKSGKLNFITNEIIKHELPFSEAVC